MAGNLAPKLHGERKELPETEAHRLAMVRQQQHPSKQKDAPKEQGGLHRIRN